MFIQNLCEPFYHTIIDNFYTDQELKLIWQELDVIITPNLLPPKDTQSQVASPLKKGIFLHDLYKNIQFSHIYKQNRKLFSCGIEVSRPENPFLDYITHKNADTTLINYYTDRAFYAEHQDNSILTAVTALWKEPKSFEGGDLVFPKHNNYCSNLKNNSMIIFPGFIDHEVSPVSMDDHKLGYGRYSITQFMTIM